MCVPSPLFCWMVHGPLPVCWVIRIPSGQRLSQYGHPVLCFCEYHWFWPDHGHTYFRLVEKQTASCFVYWDGKLVSRFSPETSLVLWIFNELDSRFVFIFYFFYFFIPIQEQMVTWMLQPITLLQCSRHVTAVPTSQCTTTSPPPLTLLTYRMSSTWS